MKKLTVLFILFASSCAVSQEVALSLTENIRLNQIGFYPSAPKTAVVISEKANEFYIATPDLKKKVYSGKLTTPVKSAFSSRITRIADFSDFNEPGKYIIVVSGLGYSYPIEIKASVHAAVAKASVKAFYYQRTAIDLPEQYAGIWHRPAGHPDNKVLIHPSAASISRPAGSVISSPRGWYDAGDYNKYIVNSGITMGTMLSAYEDFSSYYDTLSLNIPESNNGIPDLLDETLWNLRWMLTMQDPADGGVYNKLTNASFDGMKVTPEKAVKPRYVVQKGTGATLDFAAVMAQASRVFKKFNPQLPGLADSCLSAAKKGWRWAVNNPDVIYDQHAMNKRFDPKITTGGYGDREFSDEFIWAASELYAATADEQYVNVINLLPDNNMPLPSWAQVRLLGYYTLLRFQRELPASSREHTAEIEKRLIRFADELVDGVDQRGYRTVMGKSAKDYIWGSNAVAANQSIVLIQAYRITKDKIYLNHALSNLDYLLGRNATGYSFLTGYGDKTPMHPHHRLSEADGIVEPVPGLLVGGPNPGRQDKCHYTTTIPDECYTDDACSYASNEIAINWNAPFVYLVGAMEVFNQ